MKLAQCAGRDILSKSARIVPITKAVRIALRISPNHGHKSEREYNGNQEQFPDGEPELDFAIVTDCYNVDGPIISLAISRRSVG